MLRLSSVYSRSLAWADNCRNVFLGEIFSIFSSLCTTSTTADNNFYRDTEPLTLTALGAISKSLNQQLDHEWRVSLYSNNTFDLQSESSFSVGSWFPSLGLQNSTFLRSVSLDWMFGLRNWSTDRDLPIVSSNVLHRPVWANDSWSFSRQQGFLENIVHEVAFELRTIFGYCKRDMRLLVQYCPNLDHLLLSFPGPVFLNDLLDEFSHDPSLYLDDETSQLLAEAIWMHIRPEIVKLTKLKSLELRYLLDCQGNGMEAEEVVSFLDEQGVHLDHLAIHLADEWKTNLIMPEGHWERRGWRSCEDNVVIMRDEASILRAQELLAQDRRA